MWMFEDRKGSLFKTIHFVTVASDGNENVGMKINVCNYVSHGYKMSESLYEN